MSKVKEYLYKMFTKNAILGAAIYEQLDDIQYCKAHQMLPDTKKWETNYAKAEKLLKNDKTFNRDNMREFREKVQNYLKTTTHKDMYKDLSETEQYAVQKFYYFDCH